MSAQNRIRLPDVLRKHSSDLLEGWLEEQTRTVTRQKLLVKEQELREQCSEFLRCLTEATSDEHYVDISAPAWTGMRDLLANISRSRSQQGFTHSETATFVFSFKKPLFARLRLEIKAAEELGEAVWAATEVLDKLGLYTTEVYQKAREQVILRQQQDLLELSTPVVKLWDGVLALPLIGTLDSARTQVVMESLLQRIVETGSTMAIIDITGVPTVDTLVAQHLLKTVTAARLMGTDCIISGIRPQIAQTIVHLGVALGNVITKASLADAFRVALQKSGVRFTLAGAAPAERTT